MKWLCKWRGHKYNSIDILLLSIELNSLNINKKDLSIKCARCKKVSTIEELLKELADD
jgi:hypothetical protein